VAGGFPLLGVPKFLRQAGPARLVVGRVFFFGRCPIPAPIFPRRGIPMAHAYRNRRCKNCRARATRPRGLCVDCWQAARDAETNGRPIPDDLLNDGLMIQQAAKGWQLFLVQNQHWRPIGRPFATEPAAENAGQIVLAAAKILRS
jgi:hypothetical protein